MVNPISLEGLPAETLDNILSYIPKDSLANLRLASRFLQQPTKRYLYRQLTLRHYTGSAAKAKKIIERHALAGLVREFVLDARYPIPYTSLCHPLPRGIIQDLCKMDHMSSLSIVFDRTNLTAGLVHAGKVQHPSEILNSVFHSLTNRTFLPHRLVSLSIENLQSRNEPDVTTSLEFTELIRNLHTLKLKIATVDHLIISPQVTKRFEETSSFYLHLLQFWLAPASQNLRVLHLSAAVPWGWFPKVDLRDVYLPRIEDLTLVNFTFSHDWHLPWLSDHAGSLKCLRLVDCAILDHARPAKQYLDSEGYPLSTESGGEGQPGAGFHSHNKRWSHYFKAIEISLPRLQLFSLLAPDHVFSGTHLQAILDEEVKQIYSALFYITYVSNHYVSFFQEYLFQEEQANLVTKAQQNYEDEQALRELLSTIEKRNAARV